MQLKEAFPWPLCRDIPTSGHRLVNNRQLACSHQELLFTISDVTTTFREGLRRGVGKMWRSAKLYDKELAADSTVTAAGHPAPNGRSQCMAGTSDQSKNRVLCKNAMPFKGHGKQEWRDGEINAKCLNSSTLAILHAILHSSKEWTFRVRCSLKIQMFCF